MNLSEVFKKLIEIEGTNKQFVGYSTNYSKQWVNLCNIVSQAFSQDPLSAHLCYIRVLNRLGIIHFSNFSLRDYRDFPNN